MAILVTGGAGYIGSHTCIELLNAFYDIVIVDNYINSHPNNIKRISKLAKRNFKFYEIDICNKSSLEKVFKENKIDAVIHFAGEKSVSESVLFPLKYYHHNLISTIILLETMQKYNVFSLVFSSSAAVYGNPNKVPIFENSHLNAVHPYGRTKLMIEQILNDLYLSNSNWSIHLLRYFNPVGAHESGLIGEQVIGVPNNLMPYMSQVAMGKLEYLKVYGDDYNTPDGTGVRDYVHVVDLAKGHLKALEKVLESTGVEPYNLGTGKGYSVLEMIKTFEKVCNKKIPYRVVDRRPGDVAKSYADPLKAEQELGWKATRGITEMCRDTWRWYQRMFES